MSNRSTTFLTYMQCVSNLLELLAPFKSIKSVYLMGSFARGDYEVGQSDIDLTIITKNLDEQALLDLSLGVARIVSTIKNRNAQFAQILSMPKISTFSDWYNTEILDPAEYGIRDQKEAKLLLGEDVFARPIIPLCDLNTDILDSLVTHSIIAMGEATYTLMDYDATDLEKQSYWFWKSFLNALRYYFWLVGDIYLSKLQDVLSFAIIIFGERHPFLKQLSYKNKINFEIASAAYNFLTAICLKSINFHKHSISKIGICEMASIDLSFKVQQTLIRSETDFPNWFWKNWLKPTLPRKFIVLSQPVLSSSADKSTIVKFLNKLSLHKNRFFPVLIHKDVYEYFISDTNPLFGYFLLRNGVKDNIIVNPSSEKMRLISKKALAYFFYNWTNSFIETYQTPRDHYRLVNKILMIQFALIYLKAGEAETDFRKIPECFHKVFPDFHFKDYGFPNLDIELFSQFIFSLRDYIYDDVIRPKILYS